MTAAKENKIKEPAECRELLKASMREEMSLPEDAYEFENQKSVVLLIGVNGVGHLKQLKFLDTRLDILYLWHDQFFVVLPLNSFYYAIVLLYHIVKYLHFWI
mgnify:CR=1 FL=1